MATITEKDAHKNIIAVLDMIAFAEIGPEMLAKSNDGYDVLVGSLPHKMIIARDLSDHPNVYHQATNSTAAGRYQILYRYWPYYKKLLGLSDFGPLSQDRYAIQQIKEQGAYRLFCLGRFDEGVDKIRNIWASMPKAGYGQREHKLSDLQLAYIKAGGAIV